MVQSAAANGVAKIVMAFHHQDLQIRILDHGGANPPAVLGKPSTAFPHSHFWNAVFRRRRTRGWGMSAL